MTGFATLTGEHGQHEWVWDMRGVNARGLDVRLRMPDWITGLEQEIKAKANKSFARGSLQISLKIGRREEEGQLALDGAALDGVLTALNEIENRAAAHSLTLTPTSAAEILGIRGVQKTSQEPDDITALKAALLTNFDGVLDQFAQMRAKEGASLEAILSAQIDEIETLTDAAAKAAEARKPHVAETLKTNLARVMDNTDGASADRVAQELALLAVKADVTEEIDRLHAHISAARDLLAQSKPIGRKMDFLTQEFNREANTLCSKSQFTELTRIGLDLKAVIDQMREQVQNVE
ncbi:YicC family protein [Halocynthiibacter sp. C4]|uniref:YicC/YloC family endoribonuclease n=1 Tax=Halocynthiibacter sp. C4 TaxID=2992758 RepID=UPI00237A5722|nr:YicC/YloC family endoribonuclease [Halocynthiibacter sp. C4]MDE0589606.1 YicC family protein [Halocynthiibacter sp. C4]